MKVREAEMQLPLPHDQVREAPIEVEPRRVEISDEVSSAAGWIYCLARGRHDYDERGVCVNCGAERKAS